MNYIIVNASETLTSKERCELFSRELFKISKPVNQPDDVSMYLFGWINKEDLYALQVDLEYSIYVHPDKDLTTLISLLNPSATTEEIEIITQSIDGASHIPFSEILPSYVQVKTKEELEADGWFHALEDLPQA